MLHSILENVKWKAIMWLVDHRVLSVARCRAGNPRHRR